MWSYGFFICLVIKVTSSTFFMTPQQPELQLVNVVFRHSDRTPRTYEKGELYPNDPYLNYTFPKGYGQLTNVGKVRAYTLGRQLYALYARFLNHQYVPEEVHARSSDTDRTKMTLQVVMRGLFPAQGDDKWHPLFKWQPVSTVYCPVESDRILLPEKSPLFQKEFYAALQSPEVMGLMAPYSQFLQNLTELTGRLIKNPIDLLNLYNTLSSEVSLGLELPAWAKQIYSNHALSNATSVLFQIGERNQNLTKMMSGILLRKMVDDMLDKVENHGTNRKKIYLYSAHDTNIATTLVALGLYAAPHLPKYTSAVIIELLSLGSDYYVRVRYYEGIPAQSTIKTIPGCTELCPLQQFIKLIENNLASSEEELIMPSPFNEAANCDCSEDDKTTGDSPYLNCSHSRHHCLSLLYLCLLLTVDLLANS